MLLLSLHYQLLHFYQHGEKNAMFLVLGGSSLGAFTPMAVFGSLTTFLLLHLDRKIKSLVNTLYNFYSMNPHFSGFYRWFLIGVQDRKGLLISESDGITLYCQPDFIIDVPADVGFMSLIKDRILISKQNSMNATLELSEINVGTFFMNVDKLIKEVSSIKSHYCPLTPIRSHA